MYTAYWLSNSSSEDKCRALVQTWCFANGVGDKMTKEEVETMCRDIWNVWFDVSYTLGRFCG